MSSRALSESISFLLRGLAFLVPVLRHLVKRFSVPKASKKKRRGKKAGKKAATSAGASDDNGLHGALRSLHRAFSRLVTDLSKHLRAEISARQKPFVRFSNSESALPLHAIATTFERTTGVLGKDVRELVSGHVQAGQRKSLSNFLRLLSLLTTQLKSIRL